jgi:hypothetical protein
MTALRPDLVFSYWIYVWYLLYAFAFTTYSPKFPLIIGLLDNIVLLGAMFTFGTSNRTIAYFIIVNTLIKVVPLYYLRFEPIYKKDIIFTVGLFGVFIVWLHINRQSLIGNIKLIYESLLYGQDKTPFMAFINTMKKNFKSLEIV